MVALDRLGATGTAVALSGVLLVWAAGGLGVGLRRFLRDSGP